MQQGGLAAAGVAQDHQAAPLRILEGVGDREAIQAGARLAQCRLSVQPQQQLAPFLLGAGGVELPHQPPLGGRVGIGAFGHFGDGAQAHIHLLQGQQDGPRADRQAGDAQFFEPCDQVLAVALLAGVQLAGRCCLGRAASWLRYSINRWLMNERSGGAGRDSGRHQAAVQCEIRAPTRAAQADDDGLVQVEPGAGHPALKLKESRLRLGHAALAGGDLLGQLGQALQVLVGSLNGADAALSQLPARRCYRRSRAGLVS